MELGQNVRARRRALGLSLEALAARTGVSRAMLSDIERGARNPTVRIASQIAEGLACTLSDLLGTPRAADLLLVRQADRPRLIDPRSGVERHLLSPAFQRRGLELIWYVIPPGQQTGAFPPHRAGVAEHITVVRGRLDCRLGERDLTLEAGDSVAFAADLEHAFANPGAEPTEYLLVIDSSRAGDYAATCSPAGGAPPEPAPSRPAAGSEARLSP